MQRRAGLDSVIDSNEQEVYCIYSNLICTYCRNGGPKTMKVVCGGGGSLYVCLCMVIGKLKENLKEI